MEFYLVLYVCVCICVCKLLVSLCSFYFAILLNSFLVWVNLSISSFKYFRCTITSSANTFTLCFPILLPLIDFSCLIALAHTSSTISNRHSCSDLSGNISNDSSYSRRCLWTKVYICYHDKEISVNFYFHEYFLLEISARFLSKTFSASMEIIIWFFLYHLIWYILL